MWNIRYKITALHNSRDYSIIPTKGNLIPSGFYHLCPKISPCVHRDVVLLIFCTLNSFSLFFQVSSFVLVIYFLFWKFSLSVWLLGLQQEVLSCSNNTLSLPFSFSSSLRMPLLLCFLFTVSIATLAIQVPIF